MLDSPYLSISQTMSWFLSWHPLKKINKTFSFEYNYVFMDLNIFHEFQSVVVIILIDAQLSHRWSMGASNWHLCPFDLTPMVANSFLAFCHDKISRIILYIPVSDFRSSISPKNPGSFYCNVVFKDHNLVTRGAYCYWVDQLFVPFQWTETENTIFEKVNCIELLLMHPIKIQDYRDFIHLHWSSFWFCLFLPHQETPRISLSICFISVCPARKCIYSQLLGFKLLEIISMWLWFQLMGYLGSFVSFPFASLGDCLFIYLIWLCCYVKYVHGSKIKSTK